MRIAFVFCALLLAVLQSVTAQNLVPNPGFEEYTNCPHDINSDWLDTTHTSSFSHVTNWWRPTAHYSSYWNKCIQQSADSTYFWCYPNQSRARTGYGNAYIEGFTDFGSMPLPPGWDSNRGYIQAQLLSPLQAGCSYTVSFYLRLEKSHCNTTNYNYTFIDGMGAYFSDSAFYFNTHRHLAFTPQVQNQPGNLLTDSVNYMLISGTYTASGTERYITIGNFKPDSLTQHQTLWVDSIFNTGTALFAVDDVSVIPVQTTSLTLNIGQDISFAPKQALVAIL